MLRSAAAVPASAGTIPCTPKAQLNGTALCNRWMNPLASNETPMSI